MRTAMMAMTTSNSISVKPRERVWAFDHEGSMGEHLRAQ
jgi:hypothetical protein